VCMNRVSTHGPESPIQAAKEDRHARALKSRLNAVCWIASLGRMVNAYVGKIMTAMTFKLIQRLRLQPHDLGGPSRMEMLQEHADACR